MSKAKELIKVQQEKLPGSQISLEIEIPPERSQQAYEQAITKLMRSAHIPGFRKGKVPRPVILQRFGVDHLKASALEELVQKTFEAAVEQEEIQTLGNVQFRSSFDELAAQFKPGEAITFTVSVDVPPEVHLKRYQDFQVTAEKVDYDPAKIDEVLEEHRSANATLVPIEDRATLAGDVAVIDFESRFLPLPEDAAADGDASEEPEGESVQDFQLELVKGKFLDDLVEGIIGMQVGETKEIAVTLPTEYFQAELSGRTAEFTVQLKEIKAKELPPLDDDFAQDVSEFSTLVELRQFLEEQYQQEAKDSTDANIEAALLAALIAELEVDLPETMINDELNVMVRETLTRLQTNGLDVNKLMTKDLLTEMKERLRSEAIPRLQRTLALAEIAKAQSIKVEADAIQQRCQEVLQDLQGEKIDRDRLETVVEDELLHKQVIQWLTEHSQVELVEPKPEAESDAEEEPAVEAIATVANTSDQAQEEDAAQADKKTTAAIDPKSPSTSTKTKAKKAKDPNLADAEPQSEEIPPKTTTAKATAKDTAAKTTTKAKTKSTKITTEPTESTKGNKEPHPN
ncbi:MAG: trigger factor [Acaryochloris sp. RU_4_1]|nr:trigger factor [Acaryochloris sp. RU_4_1]